MENKNFSNQFLQECIKVIDLLDSSSIEKMAETIAYSNKNNGRLFIIGSGGGAGHASHAVCDFRKLCNIEAYAPYDNVSELTARVNDEGWDTTIINWLKVSRFNKKDCILVFSVGGGDAEKNISTNLVNVIKYANEIGAKSTGIVGKDGGYTKKYGDAVVVIPTVNENHITPLAEGFQAIVWHLLVSHPLLKVNSTKWESVK
jgi:D-sedoheptulose 7-phosphate isomerase